MGDAIIALAEQGTLSLMAVRLLDAALATGRNLLFTGPLERCLPLMAALVADGGRPGIYSASAYGGHADFGAELHNVPDAPPDRLAAWGLPPQNTAQALLHQVGVVAHLPASRLDRVLMRLELAFAVPPPQTPVAVLAAVDLVVVVSASELGAPRVSAVYELVMADDGYRPAPLFLTGQEPLPEALVPQRAPSFAAALVEAGHSILVAELTAACPSLIPRSSAPQATNLADAAAYGPAQAAPIVPRGPATPGKKARRPQTPRPKSSPGWELDRNSRVAEGAAFGDVMDAQGGGPAGQAQPELGPLTDSLPQDQAEDTFLGPPPKPGL